jgi:hypothetical protein
MLFNIIILWYGLTNVAVTYIKCPSQFVLSSSVLTFVKHKYSDKAVNLLNINQTIRSIKFFNYTLLMCL